MKRASSSRYEGELLLQGAWLPITSCVLFARASADKCVETLVDGVRGIHLRENYGHPLRATAVSAPSLEGFLRLLLPLEGPESWRYLIVPTANPEWCAIFDSAWRGQDPPSVMSWLGVAEIDSVSVKDVPHTHSLSNRSGSYGVRRIELYETLPGGELVGHSLGVRALSARRWELVTPTRPFPVGESWDPSARRIPEKFTHEHLRATTERFGLSPFDEEFYAPDKRGFMVERTDPLPAYQRTFSLAQARGEGLVDL